MDLKFHPYVAVVRNNPSKCTFHRTRKKLQNGLWLKTVIICFFYMLSNFYRTFCFFFNYLCNAIIHLVQCAVRVPLCGQCHIFFKDFLPRVLQMDLSMDYIVSKISSVISVMSSTKAWSYLLLIIVCHTKVIADYQSAPQFRVQPSFSGGVVTEHQSRFLQCQAVGSPPPEYQWLRDGKPLTNFSHDPVLRIANITKENNGSYQCVARNSAGTIFSQKTSLTVAFMGTSIDDEDSTVTVQNGASIILQPPSIESIPPPTVSWQKVGHGMLHGIHYALSLNNELVILAARKQDEGQYQALLLNIQAGKEVPGNIIHLSVEGDDSEDMIHPEITIPPQNSVFKQGSEHATLECVSNSRPLDVVRTVWRKDGQDLHMTGLPYSLLHWNRSLILDNVGPLHEGLYECIVSLHGADVAPVIAAANVTVMVKPSIVELPDRETVSEIGRVVLLPCSAVGNPPPVITWYRNYVPIEENFGDRFDILPNGTLQILGLFISDMGIYQCVASNDAGDDSSSTWLHVKTSAPLLIKPPKNVTVLDGKDAQILCEASGAPTPNITWVFNDTLEVYSLGRVQLLDNGNLLIASVEPVDVGKYTCTRANSAGVVSGSAYLSVLVRTQIVQPPADTRVILGTTAELQCKVSHDPAVPYVVQWYFGNKEIRPHHGDRIQILDDGSLQIDQARNADVGTYTCQVTSAGGNETRSARLYVIELPHPPNSVKAVLLNTVPKSVNVSWSKAFNGNSPIINYIVQMRVVPPDPQIEYLLPWVTAVANISGSQRFIILTNLQPASSYEFRVSAVNGVGEGNPSIPTDVIHLPPEPPSGPPQGVVGGARSPTSVMLQWQPPSEQDHNGELHGYSIRYKLAKYVGSPWVQHNISNAAQHSFVLQDLIIWQNYEIQVAAFNEKGIGVYSESIYVRTKQGIPQLAPTNVKVEAINSTAVKVWWKPPDQQFINGINLGYKVRAWVADRNFTGSPALSVLVAPSILDPEAEQHTSLSGLKKYTTYHITVLCFTSPGDGPSSEPVVVTTKQDIPDEVGSLKFEDILDTSVKVVWSVPVSSNGVLKGYTLRYHIKDAPETTVVKNISAEATSVIVTDLRPVTAYSFEIFAWTVIGPGPSRTAVIQSGIPPVLPGPPSKLAVSNIGAFSVVLQFTPGFDGNSSIIKWTVESQTRRNESWVKVYEVSDPDATNLQVYNLVPFTEYRLRLIATNVVGSSDFSEPSKFFQTIQAPPSHPPYNVTVRAVSDTSLRVRWTPLQQVEWYGIPRGYNIQFRQLEENEEITKNYTFSSIILEDHNANSYVLRGLEEFTEYEVFVQSFNDVGSSNPSPKAVEKTRESVPSAGPQNIKINATSSTTIVVKWEEVPKIHQNGIIEGYKVYYGAKVVPFQYKKIESNSTFTTTLTELRKYTLYSVQVLAYSRIGDGVLSVPPVSIRTFEDVPGAPSNVSFPDVTTTTARILWDVPVEPNGEILAYRISYNLRDSSDSAEVIKVAPTERTYKAVNLEPEMYYLFSVVAESNEGWGKTAEALVYTTNNREAPQAPTVPHISKSQIQARQITFSWTPGRDGFAPLRFYTVQIAEGDDAPWKTIPLKIDPLVSTYTVTNLKPFTSYKFRIRATNDIGASSWSMESNVTLTLSAAPEHAPQQIIVTPYTTTSVRVSWLPLNVLDWNGEIYSAGYRVEYCQMTPYAVTRSADCPSEKIFGRNHTVLSLQDLERDRTYEIKVYAFNKEGDGPPSRPVPVFVGEAVPTGEPLNVKAEAKRSTEIEVSWQPPPPDLQNGDLLGYKIFYEPRNGMAVVEEMEAVPPSTTSYSLLDLKKYTEYNIQVLAFNPAGDGPRSAVVFARTMEDIPGAPGLLHFSDITMTSLNVSWEPPSEPNGKITGYLVTYETALSEIDFSKQVKQKVTTTYLSVHGLAETVTYTFRVRAETFDFGPESVRNITTGPQEGSPSSPEDLMLRHTHSSVTLQWKNGAEGSSPIIGYLIEFMQSGGKDPWQTLVLLNNGVQTSYTISFRHLLPSTSYQFRLFSRNMNGISYPALPQPFATPSKLLLEQNQRLPFYREVWFLVMLAAVSVVVIILVVAVLCVKSKVYKYKKEVQKSYHDDHVSMDDGGFATFELCQSKRGTLCKNAISRKNNNTVLTKPPPRPSPGSVTYSDDEDVKGYDENCDSSSLTEKPSEMSSSESQGSDSERESDDKCDPHSFVNHYANVNDTLRQSWKRQRPVKPPSYTDSEPEGSIQVSLNGGQIVMNNMAGSRAPLPGFSSFV